MSQHDTLTLEQIVGNYLSDYELRGEDSEGRDAALASSARKGE